MKLLYCPSCGDIFNLTYESKKCSCGKVYGHYLPDGLHAIYNKGIPLCINNNSLKEALQKQEKNDVIFPQEIYGARFESWICPASSNTFNKEHGVTLLDEKLIRQPREGWAEQIKKAELETLYLSNTPSIKEKIIQEINTPLNECVEDKEYPEHFGTEEDRIFEYYMSLPYKIVIYPASEGGYVAEIPDLPGCLTQGDNWQDTFEMIQDAKAAWIDIALQDGQEIPEPK